MYVWIRPIQDEEEDEEGGYVVKSSGWRGVGEKEEREMVRLRGVVHGR